MNLVKTMKTLLENLYIMYSFGNDGEMVIINELDCYIYKGKKLHHNQNLIIYNSDEGTIKIDGIENDNSIISKSYIKINGKKEVGFDIINENDEELQFLNNIIIKINNIVNSNNVSRETKEVKKL